MNLKETVINRRNWVDSTHHWDYWGVFWMQYWTPGFHKPWSWSSFIQIFPSHPLLLRFICFILLKLSYFVILISQTSKLFFHYTKTLDLIEGLDLTNDSYPHFHFSAEKVKDHPTNLQATWGQHIEFPSPRWLSRPAADTQIPPMRGSNPGSLLAS